MSNVDRPRIALYVVLALVVCVLGVRYLRGQPASVAQDAGGPVAQETAGKTAPADAGDGSATVALDRAGNGRVMIHVAGAVRRPGLYRLAAGSRVDDALRRAGGPRPRADLTAVNLAAKLEDGRQVIVPERATGGGAAGAAGAGTPAAPPAAGAPGSAPAPAPPVNLNTATLEQLDTLDGVGPGIAQRIIDYREQHGGFRTVDELGEVPGIGDKRMATLRPAVTV